MIVSEKKYKLCVMNSVAQRFKIYQFNGRVLNVISRPNDSKNAFASDFFIPTIFTYRDRNSDRSLCPMFNCNRGKSLYLLAK